MRRGTLWLTPARRVGFSLIEMLAVLALLLLVASLYWRGTLPSQAQLQQKACQKNLEQVFMALQVYAHDNGGRYPVQTGVVTSSQALQVLVPRYTIDPAPFICPVSGEPPLKDEAAFRRRPISYAYYLGRGDSDGKLALMSDRQVSPNAGALGRPLFSATGERPGNNHGKNGGNLLSCDGEVTWLSSTNTLSPDSSTGGVVLNPE